MYAHVLYILVYTYNTSMYALCVAPNFFLTIRRIAREEGLKRQMLAVIHIRLICISLYTYLYINTYIYIYALCVRPRERGSPASEKMLGTNASSAKCSR